MFVVLLRLPRSKPVELFHHMGVVQQTHRATCACQTLARLLLKNDSICAPWLGKAEPRVGDCLINVILARTTVSYIASRDRGSEVLARHLLESHYFLCTMVRKTWA